MWPTRGVDIVGPATNRARAGSKNSDRIARSASSQPSAAQPPATSTRPSGSSVAVWEARLTTISGPVAEVAPVAGAAPGGAAGAVTMCNRPARP